MTILLVSILIRHVNVLTCFKILIFACRSKKKKKRKKDVLPRQNKNLASQFSEYTAGILLVYVNAIGNDSRNDCTEAN